MDQTQGQDTSRVTPRVSDTPKPTALLVLGYNVWQNIPWDRTYLGLVLGLCNALVQNDTQGYQASENIPRVTPIKLYLGLECVKSSQGYTTAQGWELGNTKQLIRLRVRGRIGLHLGLVIHPLSEYSQGQDTVRDRTYLGLQHTQGYAQGQAALRVRTVPRATMRLRTYLGLHITNYAQGQNLLTVVRATPPPRVGSQEIPKD